MRGWDDKDLEHAVAGGYSIAEVMRRLGLKKSSSGRIAIRKHIQRLGLDTSHFGVRSDRRRWTDADLADAVRLSVRISEVCDRLGLQRGGNYTSLRKHIDRLGLDTSHFDKRHPSPGNRIPLSEILVKNSSYTNTSYLKHRLVREGVLDSTCSECGGGPMWNGKSLTLQLDHINGIRSDNRAENLRLLCPNCHSQTSTYCGKNRS